MFPCVSFPLFSHGTRVVSNVTTARKALTHAIVAKDLTRKSTALSTTPSVSDQKATDSVEVLAAFRAKNMSTGN